MKKSESNEYGIETLKKFSLIIIKLGMKLELMVWNWKAVLFSLVPFIIRNSKVILELWNNKDQIYLEFKDLNESEKLQLTIYVSNKLNLQNDKIEKIIEMCLDTIAVFSDKIQKLINLIRNGKR